MSFILDALKKSETERQRADTPALYEMKMAPARPRLATWLIVLVALLVINIVVLSVVLLRGNRTSASQADASGAGTPAAAAVGPGAQPAANQPATAASAAPSAVPGTVPAASAAASAQPPDSATGTPAGANDDDAPAVDATRTAAGTRASGGADSADVPTYEQAASAPGANLPELKLDLHAYASNPADRFVFLNAVNLKEGQTSPTGVRVESITPDGAILSWQGTRFFLHSQ
jgi:general secretion pathway protein B